MAKCYFQLAVLRTASAQGALLLNYEAESTGRFAAFQVYWLYNP